MENEKGEVYDERAYLMIRQVVFPIFMAQIPPLKEEVCINALNANMYSKHFKLLILSRLQLWLRV